MISSINSRNIIGIDSCDIKVEVDIGKGMPTFNIVGLASTEIKEARERVKSAITNSGYRFPNARIVVNLSPADMKKQGFNIVGLASTEIKEARERVKSAITNSGYRFPNARIVVNLSPADMKKQGSFLDLPISLGILRDKIRAKDKEMTNSVFVGELSLDGTVKSIKGILPIVIGARENGYEKIFIPRDNFKECSFIDDQL